MNVTMQPGMDKCSPDEAPLTKYCYETHPSGYVVYEDYLPCMNSWILLPGFELMPKGFLAAVYFAFLMYLFLGISILSDVFMGSIEVITSAKREMKRIDAKTGKALKVEVDVWNATVANLTLLALGSSAPEILLALIETLTALGSCEEQNPGELGAATIVGSASFNLLAISAVCMMSVPVGEVRKVSEFKVFLVTATFSLFAYIWVYIVYEISSKEIVKLWEALVTLALFPVLIVVAYGADRGWFNCGSKVGADVEHASHKPERIMNMNVDGHHVGGAHGVHGMAVDKTKIAQMMKDAQKGGLEKDDYMTKNIFMHLFPMPVMSRARYRINAVRMLGGKKFKKQTDTNEKWESRKMVSRPSTKTEMKGEVERLRQLDSQQMLREMRDSPFTCFAFRSKAYTVLENAGTFKAVVHRGGPLDGAVSVKYKTSPGTAFPTEDYTHTEGTLTFEKDVETMEIPIEIVNDDQYEPDENFFIELSDPSEGSLLMDKAEITIIDDDEPGMLVFAKSNISVMETAKIVQIEVKRIRGASGKVSVGYVTEDGTAFADKDFTAIKGELTFDHNEVSKTISIEIVDDDVPEVNKQFSCRLFLPKGGATISKHPLCEITIVDDDDVNNAVLQITDMLDQRNQLLSVSTSSWKQQFMDAVQVGGGDDGSGESEEIGYVEILVHYCSITWKLFAACIPPTDIWGGWATFSASLAATGFITAIVGEVATLFGCACGLKDAVTAISFVALGTSLPDTFASRQATIESPDADSAIGNVTGSNSVNVFLGLGLPWTLAALYYEVGLGCDYEVKSGALAFSVMIFMVFAVVCLSVIMLRRFFGPGELGGGEFGKKSCAALFFFMWFMYIVLSSLNAYEHIEFGSKPAPSPPPPTVKVQNPRMIP